MSRHSLNDLYYDLMKFEIELEEQLEENMDDFERTLSALTDEFLQAIEVNVMHGGTYAQTISHFYKFLHKNLPYFSQLNV